MKKSDYRPRGVYQKKLKYFVSGVMIGSKIQIEERIQDLKSEAQKFYYKRRRFAVAHATGDFALRGHRR